MNKKFILAAIMGISLGLSGLTSCKKCMKCEYTEHNTNIPRKREACGNKDQLDLFQADVVKEAKAFGNEEEDVKCAYK